MPPRLDKNNPPGGKAPGGNAKAKINEKSVVPDKAVHQIGGTLMPPFFDSQLPEVFPVKLDLDNWSPQQMDIWFDIPASHRGSLEKRKEWIEDWKVKQASMGMVHDTAMKVAGCVGKAVLRQAQKEIATFTNKNLEMVDTVNSFKKRIDVVENCAKNDYKSSMEILVTYKQMLDEVLPKWKTEQDQCRRVFYEFLKHFAREELRDWEDVEEVRPVGTGARQRLCVRLMSNHQRNRIIKTWNKSGKRILVEAVGLSEEEADEVQMVAGKTAYRQQVDRELWKFYSDCNAKNIASNGKTFWVVDKTSEPGQLRVLKELPANSPDPRIVKAKKAWETNKKKDKQQHQSLSQPPPNSNKQTLTRAMSLTQMQNAQGVGVNSTSSPGTTPN